MTIAEIRQRVSEIAAVADDYERAHAMEDDLWEEVLRFIATGGGSVGAHFLAQELLKTRELVFTRFCG